MKQNISINVSDKPKTNGVVSCKRVTVRERLLNKLFGSTKEIMVLLPGDKVSELAIRNVKEECNI